MKVVKSKSGNRVEATAKDWKELPQVLGCVQMLVTGYSLDADALSSSDRELCGVHASILTATSLASVMYNSADKQYSVWLHLARDPHRILRFVLASSKDCSLSCPPTDVSMQTELMVESSFLETLCNLSLILFKHQAMNLMK
jgi:hypothetical protein